jgi:hypothetical protein
MLQLNGDESWVISVNGPGGYGLLVTVDDIKGVGNSAYYLSSITAGNVQASAQVSNYYLTATLTAPLTVITPDVPADGQFITIINGTGGAFTQTIFLQSAVQTIKIGNVSNLGPGASAQWQYVAGQMTWYRTR